MNEYIRIKPGDYIDGLSEADFNRRQAEIERRQNLSVSHPLAMIETPFGRILSCGQKGGILAKLSGSSSPYSFKQVAFNGMAASPPTDASGYVGTSNLYEINNVAGLDGKVIYAIPGFDGDWRGQYIQSGTKLPTGTGGGGCTTFQVTANYTDGTPYPGMPISIIGDLGTVIASGVTNGSGVYTWNGSGGLYALGSSIVLKPETAPCQCPAIFDSVGNGLCVASFTVCDRTVIINVEAGGVLGGSSLYNTFCGPCKEIINYQSGGPGSYTFRDFGIASEGGYGCGVGSIPRPGVGGCSDDAYWRGCVGISPICQQTVTYDIVAFPKSEYNFNIPGDCSNDRRLVIPKKLYVTNNGPSLTLGSNAGKCIEVDWVEGSWDGNPATYRQAPCGETIGPGIGGPQALLFMRYAKCTDAGGAYGMCTPLNDEGNVSKTTKINYGSAKINIDFSQETISAAYRNYFAPACPPSDTYPDCGIGDTWTTTEYCVGSIPHDNSDGTVTYVSYYIFLAPIQIGYFDNTWVGTVIAGSYTEATASLYLTHDSRNFPFDANGFQGPDPSRYPGCEQPDGSVIISESCGGYGYAGASGDMVKMSSRPFTPAVPPSPKLRVGWIAPCLGYGGAETHQRELALATGDRIHWAGCVVVGGPIEQGAVDLLSPLMPVGFGPDAAAKLESQVDILISWAPKFQSRSVPTIFVAHFPPIAHPEIGEAPYYVAVSDSALASLPPPKWERAVVIPHAIDRPRIAPRRSRAQVRQAWGLPFDATTVGFFSRHVPEKNPWVMLGLAAAMPEIHVVMAGYGSMIDELRDASPPNCHVLGPMDDPGDFYVAIDTLVVPSDHESWGYTMAEGAISGIPLITTDTGVVGGRADLARFIPFHATGTQLAEAVRANLADPAGTQARADRCRRWAEAEFGVERFGQRWSDYLEKTVADAKSGPSLWKMFGNVTKAIVTYAASGFQNVSPEVAEKRKQICMSCPEWIAGADQCRPCGCKLRYKRLMATERCPLDPPRWAAET